MNSAASAYQSNSVATASPVRLLLMLCDRLVLDIERAQRAQMARDRVGAHNQLIHAQAIVTELQTSLRPDEFRGGHELAALYAYIEARLIHANTHNDQHATAETLRLCQEIRDTWHEAARLSAGA